MRWAKYVAHNGEKRGSYRVLVGNLWERDHCEGGRIILKWIIKHWMLGHGLD